MENSNAQKIIKNLQAEVIANGFNANLVAELKKLREFALLEEKPVLVKSLRLAYEHIEKNNDFLVQIPSDEPIEEELNTENNAPNTNTESFTYFMSLMLDLDNKHNIADLKDYNTQFQDF